MAAREQGCGRLSRCPEH